MKAATYSRSLRRSWNMKMSDCQSWLGCARSKRRRGRGPRSTFARAVCSSSPASFRILRTLVGDTPSASNLFSSSEMRRVPSVALFCFNPRTALRIASSSLRTVGGRPGGLGRSASGPPSW